MKYVVYYNSLKYKGKAFDTFKTDIERVLGIHVIYLPITTETRIEALP
jgi:hypothetical protein